jgi:hemerythrin
MPIVTWSAKYETGNIDVDTQHLELFRIVNFLHDGILAGKEKDVMVKTLEDLANYVAKHFRAEEKLMLREAFPDYAHHKAIHEKLSRDTGAIIDGYRSGKLVLTVALSRFLSDWLQVHIEVEDMRMINFIRNKNRTRVKAR